MEELSSSISSRSLLTSFCNCCLSCWSFPICSTVFCSVTALLIWMHQGGKWQEKVRQKHGQSPHVKRTHALTFDWVFRVGTRLQSVLKPMLMWDRLFCSADMCVDLRVCRSSGGTITKVNMCLMKDCSETAKTCLQGSAPTCFCSFFTKGVQLPLLSDPGLGTWSNRHGEPWSDPGLLWTALKKKVFLC